MTMTHLKLQESHRCLAFVSGSGVCKGEFLILKKINKLLEKSRGGQDLGPCSRQTNRDTDIYSERTHTFG